MATLYLDHINRSLPTLREWLSGNWGMLLSHPSDFEDQSTERDRWLEIIQNDFRASGVKPIACRHTGGEPDRGWISTVMGDERRVRLTYGDAIDIAARRLRDQVVGVPTTRFAMVVDPSLNCQGVLMYQRCPIGISPLELLGPIAKLRSQPHRQDPICWPFLRSPAISCSHVGSG
jgi:alkyl hydroperoxide reductase subunit AhpC